MKCSRLDCDAEAVDWVIWEGSTGRRIIVGVCGQHEMPEVRSGWVEIGGGGDLDLIRSLFGVSE